MHGTEAADGRFFRSPVTMVMKVVHILNGECKEAEAIESCFGLLLRPVVLQLKLIEQLLA